MNSYIHFGIDNSLFVKTCNSSRTDYFGCWVNSKYEGPRVGRGCWRFYSTSYAVVSRFASMFSYIPDAEIDLFCVHFNN